MINHLGERPIIMVPRLRSKREDLIQQAVAEGAGGCMLPERSAIVEGLTLRPGRYARPITHDRIPIDFGIGSGLAAASHADPALWVVVNSLGAPVVTSKL
jgi:hypothetical protein